ncbi:MAG: ATP synthase F1 subunit delta [Saprospiraceae bacterium]|nr:ATP synthase F1 subunit delta [Saprospiraceae bacterium]
MSVHRIASRYAKSLLDLAIEQNKLERIAEDVKAFKAATKIPDFKLLLKSPIVHADKKTAIIKSIFDGKFDVLTMAFLNILISKGREMHLADIAVEFDSQYRKVKHISTVTLTTASPVNEATLKAVHEKLSQSTATDSHIELTAEVDPGLIGGFIVEFEDKVYDASVAHKLKQLKKEFDDNPYVSQIVSR